jgi:hypothetical protein
MNAQVCEPRRGQDLPDYNHYVERLRPQYPALAETVDGLPGIEQVLQWMQELGLHQAAVDMVGQDEFNYDFLVELEPDGRWLCFGVT